jgi:cell division protein FtsL
MTKSSASSTKLLLVLLCIIMIGAAFYFGFKNFNDQAKEIEAENEALQAQIDPLQQKVDNIPTYKSETAANNSKVKEIANKYGAGYTPESLIAKYMKMEEECEAALSLETYGKNLIVYQDLNVDTVEGQGLTAYKSEIGISGTTSYEGIKKIVTFINEFPDRTTIDDISIGLVEEVGYSITATISEYAMIGGDDKAYEAPEFDNAKFGVKNIFGDLTTSGGGASAR